MKFLCIVVSAIKVLKQSNLLLAIKPARWSHGNAFDSEAVGLRFKSWTGQIGLRVANSSPPLRRFFESEAVLPGRNDAEMGLAYLLKALA